jgi:hypothetical protein
MSRTLPTLVVALGLLAGGCATVTTGTTQAITVDSEPQQADCTLTRDGADLGTVKTPGPVTVKRHASTIHVTCRKDGHEDAKVVMNSRYETASSGNVLLGGVIGAIVDSSTGAANRYDQYVMVRLPAMSPADQAAAAAARPKPPAPTTPSVASAPAAPAPSDQVAAAPPAAARTELAAGPIDTRFNGEYFGHVDMPGTSNLAPIRVRFVGGKASSPADRPRCYRAGKVDMVALDGGKVEGTGMLVGDIGCALVPVKISGRSEGNNLRLTFEFTFDRR